MTPGPLRLEAAEGARVPLSGGLAVRLTRLQARVARADGDAHARSMLTAHVELLQDGEPLAEATLIDGRPQVCGPVTLLLLGADWSRQSAQLEVS